MTRIVGRFQQNLGPYIVAKAPLAGSADASSIRACDRERTLARVHDHVGGGLSDTAGKVTDVHRVRAGIGDGCVGDNRVLISAYESARTGPGVR